jgi:hypothetical protein
MFCDDPGDRRVQRENDRVVSLYAAHPVSTFVIIRVDFISESNYIKAYFFQVVKCWIIEIGSASWVLLIP